MVTPLADNSFEQEARRTRHGFGPIALIGERGFTWTLVW